MMSYKTFDHRITGVVPGDYVCYDGSNPRGIGGIVLYTYAVVDLYDTYPYAEVMWSNGRRGASYVPTLYVVQRNE